MVLDKLSEKEREIHKLIEMTKSDGFSMGLNDFVMEVKSVLPDLKVTSEVDGIVKLEEKMTQMVQLLAQISSNSANISQQLNDLHVDEEPTLKY